MTLPKDFEDYTRALFGEERYAKFLASFYEKQPVSVRLNPFKPGKEFQGKPIPWCKDGLWLDSRPDFTLDPLLHCGCYYVQEAGSMFLYQVLKQYVDNPVQMLDLCAAPGGKSTLARAALPKGSILYSNEPDHKRANILTENLQKQGHPDIIVTNNYPIDYKKSRQMFDVILTDVPCSGEGMFRKDEGAVKEWSIQNVIKCRDLQRSIVEDIWPCLTDGGLLIYSTCTFNTRENEENVRWIAEEMGAEILSVETSQEWNITGSLLEGFNAPVYRFIPGITPSEGLFMAVLRKHGDYSPVLSNTRQSKKKKDKQKSQALLRIMHDGNNIAAKENNPPHAEALLYNLSTEKYPQAELNLQQALSYLHREAITLPDTTPRDYIIVTFEGHPLGFVKNIGNRANNLYPQEWRIRKEINN